MSEESKIRRREKLRDYINSLSSEGLSRDSMAIDIILDISQAEPCDDFNCVDRGVFAALESERDQLREEVGRLTAQIQIRKNDMEIAMKGNWRSTDAELRDEVDRVCGQNEDFRAKVERYEKALREIAVCDCCGPQCECYLSTKRIATKALEAK